MEPKHILQHIRNKPEKTRTRYAFLLALAPPLLVCFAQFYVRYHSEPATQTGGAAKQEDVSAFAALGKIFETMPKRTPIPTAAAQTRSLDDISPAVLQNTGHFSDDPTYVPSANASPNAAANASASTSGDTPPAGDVNDESWLPDKYTHRSEEATDTATDTDTWRSVSKY